MRAIFERRSYREYSSKRVDSESLKKILSAGMHAPSAGNGQPWEFIIVKERALYNKIMAVHPYAKALATAPCAVVVCGNTQKGKYPEYWVQDCSAAAQNMLIEAEFLGIGSLWMGVYPDKERVASLKEIFQLPAHLLPLGVFAFGYAKEKRVLKESRFNSSLLYTDVYGNEYREE